MNDDTPMPYGKHQGTPMSKVPAKYLFWLWTNGLESQIGANDVADYIASRLEALQRAHPDGIW